jgi:carbon starvation protein CstA
VDEPRPSFIWFIVVAVTIVFAVLYYSLPETFEAVDAGRPGRFRLRQEPKFLGKQVNQRPMLISVWLVIVVPLAAWGVVVTRRASQ